MEKTCQHVLLYIVAINWWY